MKTQFITDDHGKKVAVILPVKDYEKMMEELDELECIKAYDKAKARKQEFIPAADVFKAIEQKRKHT
jgi:PHD/YefM family antitoxin component YafN of YafNO toxin-antitoxin module